MQAIESKIIKNIQYNLLVKGINALSIHDSIYVSRSNRYILRNIIKELFEYGFMEEGIHIEDNNSKERNRNNNNNLFFNKSKSIIQSYSGYKKNQNININIEKDKKEDNLIKNEKRYEDKLKNYDSYITEMRKLLLN